MKRTEAWQAMRATHLVTYPECRACGDMDPSNHVHHLRYRGKRGQSEKPGDLVTLCRLCHEEFHRHFPHQTGVARTLEFIAHKQIEEDLGFTWIA